ncbi:hypothetical protein CXF68_01975 [Tenacibaculum sp. Bg11-29]|uniref:restriction endonuclease subunit S n=1 Tax=Tenacibaculum sp. Bg11-29 TaxID=2058306 RepID=UPI000C343950|nr:restriction endonuclease subunit S [Tenacibaculum sp. Bg11-29]PKH49531.1 hypothetical protein CXF68_01975 [Tenacibaculum sp. Bg11-29]
MEVDKILFKNIFDFQAKSKLKASEGFDEGSFSFYTSSPKQRKYTESPEYFEESIIIGNGGVPNIHYEGRAFSTTSHCFVVRLKDDMINEFETKFVYYYLFGNIHILANGFKGVGLKNISKTYINKIEIPKYAIEDQKRYINRFDKIQNLINRKSEFLSLLDEFLLSTFIKTCGDPILNNKNHAIAKIDNLKLEKNNSIKSGPFGSTLKKEFYTPKGYKVYGQEQVVNGLDYGNYFISLDKYNELINYKVESKDVLITLMGVVGKVAVIPSNFEEGIINPRLMKISFNQKKIKSEYFQFLFQHSPYRKKVVNSARGIAMKGLNLKIVKNLEIPLPEISIQNKFLWIKKNIELQKIRSNQSLDLLEELFQTLIYKTFNEIADKTKKDEINLLIEDDILIENLINSLNSHEYSSSETYDDEVKKLFQVLNRTKKEHKNSRKGILQTFVGKKIVLQTQKKYIDNNDEIIPT